MMIGVDAKKAIKEITRVLEKKFGYLFIIFLNKSRKNDTVKDNVKPRLQIKYGFMIKSRHIVITNNDKVFILSSNCLFMVKIIKKIVALKIEA